MSRVSSSKSNRDDDVAIARAALSELRETIEAATLEVVWRQWSALGGMASARRRAKALVDPEALILISLTLEPLEPRLADLLAGWMLRNSDLLSVQRTRNLSVRYPAPTRARLGALARIAFQEGKDHRWQSLIDGGSSELTRRGNKQRAVRAAPVEPAALTLRLRLAFGVGIKADLLSFLLSTDGGAGASVAVIATATAYTVAAVRKAARDLAEARLIEAITENRTEFAVHRAGWSELLGVKNMPKWRGWNERFVFVADFLNWATDASDRPLTTYVLESAGRDLLKAHERAFRWHRVWHWSDSDATPTTAGMLTSAISALSKWMLNQA